MTIETGLEIIDAIIHNPMEAIILFAGLFALWKYLLGNGRFARDNRHDLRSWMWWQERKIIRWGKRRTYKQFLILYFSVFPTIITYQAYNIIFEWTGTGRVQFAQEVTFGIAVLFPTTLMILTLITYLRRRKIKNEGNNFDKICPHKLLDCSDDL